MKEKMADGWFWFTLAVFAFVLAGGLLGYLVDKFQRPG